MDKYKEASHLANLIAANSLSKLSIPIFIWTLDVAMIFHSFSVCIHDKHYLYLNAEIHYYV